MANVKYTLMVILLVVGLHKQRKNRPLLPLKDIQLMKKMSDVLFEGTSLNCTGNAPQNKTCHFRNLCYSHSRDLFVYIHSPNSRELFEEGSGREALSRLPLTSVTNFEHFARFKNVTSQQFRHSHHDDDFMFYPGKYIIYTRYVANNILHVFHDELIPLFYTLLQQFEEHQQFPSIKLFIKDRVDIGDFATFYNVFSPHPPLFSYELGLELDETITCFQEATIGLVREAAWYQHGVKEPEGPNKYSSVTAKHIRQFTIFLKQKLEIYPHCSKVHYGILLSRKKNRFLLNEKELQAAISDEFQMDMIELSLDHYSISFIIEKVSCAKLVVGVHGALLVVGMFLPPSTMLMEIFPYAMKPAHRTTYRTLIQLPGMDITYACWRNMNKTKTVTHPFARPTYGGISHLSPIEQERINNITEVPHSKGGPDPEWRFRLYQDTIVDIPAVIDVLKEHDLESLLDS